MVSFPVSLTYYYTLTLQLTQRFQHRLKVRDEVIGFPMELERRMFAPASAENLHKRLRRVLTVTAVPNLGEAVPEIAIAPFAVDGLKFLISY